MNKWIENDWVLRISSVILAIILWLIVTHSFPFQQDNETTIKINDVHVETKYNQDQYSLQEISDRKVNLTLSGNKKSLSAIPSYRVYLDLSKVKSGQSQKVPVRVMGLPKNIDVKASPSTISVVMEKKAHKEMPIYIKQQGKLPQGFEIEQVIASPDRALLKGTESQLKRIKRIQAVINLNKEQLSFEKWVRLQAIGDQGRIKGLQVTPESVKVMVTVRTPSKKLPLTFEIIKQPPPGYQVKRIELEPASVTLYGAIDILQSINHYPPIPLDLSQVIRDQTISTLIPVIEKDVHYEPKQIKVKVYITQE